MRGDVVLFKSDGSPYNKAIEIATGGPYTHVEIDLGDGRWMGAHADGITIHPAGAVGRGTVAFHPPASELDIEYGLKWAVLQAGKQYGWGDILSNGFKLLNIPIDISSPGTWDCSDFVSRYLMVARASGPLGKLADDTTRISPNDIARAYGILK